MKARRNILGRKIGQLKVTIPWLCKDEANQKEFLQAISHSLIRSYTLFRLTELLLFANCLACYGKSTFDRLVIC